MWVLSQGYMAKPPHPTHDPIIECYFLYHVYLCSSFLPSFILPQIPLFLCVGTSATGSKFPLCSLSALWSESCSCSPFFLSCAQFDHLWPKVAEAGGQCMSLWASPSAAVAVLQEPSGLTGVCNRFQDSLLSLSLLSPHLCKHMKETWESIKPQKTNHGQNKYTVC